MSTHSNEAGEYMPFSQDNNPFSHKLFPHVSKQSDNRPFDASLEVNFSAAPGAYDPADFSKAVGGVAVPEFTHGAPDVAPYVEGDGTEHIDFNDGSKELSTIGVEQPVTDSPSLMQRQGRVGRDISNAFVINRAEVTGDMNQLIKDLMGTDGPNPNPDKPTPGGTSVVF